MTYIQGGLKLLSLPETRPDVEQLPYRSMNSSSIIPRKRKISATDLEIPDSEGEDDEDYGWAEDDEETVPELPPQWQGSEDILIAPPVEQEADSEGDNSKSETEEENKELRHETTTANAHFRDVIDDSEDELAL